MQNTFRDAALFEPKFVFKASRDQLQPQYKQLSLLRHPERTAITFKGKTGTINHISNIRTAIAFKAKAGTINPHPILMAITFKANTGTINPQPIWMAINLACRSGINAVASHRHRLWLCGKTPEITH
ncbi:hypothetical protein DFH08DRAFT_819197 [Mycena albidolilacea]|uniref:Uncharacterized protein n=1 Tax=Mycena albidolilacea TaxID=1033008 RepID=A0AAD7EFN7_9AGAR|nr:hypothetical protein DFH08DRAFT_823893 [Mycena albidolilacea]KAJ7319249.1 hypothetical protein DFH08DRAFT_819197 [Mycena albidolilacea]